MKLKIKALTEEARKVFEDHGHFHEGDAGLDLYALEDIVVNPGETVTIHFGISCEPEDGKAYFLIPRSSISKTPLRMANSIGLIDGGYRGPLLAKVDNITQIAIDGGDGFGLIINPKAKPYTIEKGQRLFQLVAADVSPIYYELVDELTETTRGSGGFGSTGK